MNGIRLKDAADKAVHVEGYIRLLARMVVNMKKSLEIYEHHDGAFAPLVSYAADISRVVGEAEDGFRVLSGMVDDLAEQEGVDLDEDEDKEEALP